MQMLVTADGRVRPSQDKFQLMKHLEGLPQSWLLSHPTNLENLHQSAVVIDAMMVAWKQVVNKTDIKYCKDLSGPHINFD